MTTLTGRQPKDSYKDLLQVSNSNAGVDTTVRSVEDGEGTASALQLSTTTVNVNGTLQIGGVAVTATAAEINKLDIATPGTVETNKAIVTGASDKTIDTLAINALYIGSATSAGNAVSSTAQLLDQYSLTMDIADGSADADYYLVVPHTGVVAKIWSVTDGSVGTADITITPYIGATPITDGAITIATSGSAAGDIDSATPSASNSVSAGSKLKFTVAGGGSGGSPRIHLVVVIER